MTKTTIENTEDTGIPPTRVRRIVWSVVCAGIVFGGFLAYAYLAPTTYRAITEVHLHVPPGLENSLHPIADRKHRLTKAVVAADDSLKQVGKALEVTTPQQRLELAHELNNGVSIASSDGQVFQIECTSAGALRAQRLCQALGRIAAASLPEVALLRDDPVEQERREKVEKLLAFLSQHPELSGAKGSAPAQDKASGQPASADALLNALTQQRRVVIAELNELQRVDPKNPYADGVKHEALQANKRLAAIDAALATRRKGLEGADQGANDKLDSQAMAELTNHLNQLAVREPKPTRKAALKASVTKEASLPSSPIVPDRRRLIILGALASLGVAILGLGFAFTARTRSVTVRPAAPRPAPGFTAPVMTHEHPPAVAPPNFPAMIQGGDYQPMDTAIQVVPAPQAFDEPRAMNLTTTQVIIEDALDPRPAAPRQSRTQLGGFDLAAPRPAEKPSRPDQPISGKTVVALEANVDGESEDAMPHTLVGGLQASRETSRDASRESEPRVPAAKPYTPPKRNITRRLGSLSWLDQAELSRAPAEPVSTRYSYVSSRPPPADAADENQFTAATPEVIEVPAEPEAPSTALSVRRPHPLPPLPLTRRHPVPNGWNVPSELLKLVTPELAGTVSEGWRLGCIVVGVTSRSEITRAKSSVAASLAFKLGDFVPRVLLMEGDFQDPNLHRLLRVEMPIAGGLSQQLQLRLARGSVPDYVWDVMECHQTVDVLAEGFIRSPGGILSQQFEQCLNDLRTCYDVIVLDGPPTSTGSESQAFADLVDGVVVCMPGDRPATLGQGHGQIQGLADGLFRKQRFIVPFPLRA